MSPTRVKRPRIVNSLAPQKIEIDSMGDEQYQQTTVNLNLSLHIMIWHKTLNSLVRSIIFIEQ